MNLYDYLERQTASFDEVPLGPVDSAALSQFCMVRADGVAPGVRVRAQEGPLAHPALDGLADRWHALTTRPARFADFLDVRRFEGAFTGLDPTRVKQELALLVANPRFRDLQIRDHADVFDAQDHVQFAATAFVWRREWAYVGFRGTDQSFVGWREDFDMADRPPVPAQRMAVEYLDAVARHLPRRLYVGGHSKGGNLATYAALRCAPEVRARIERVFDHDGPGFKRGFVGAGEFDLLAGRIDRTVPEESVVGQLMRTPAPTRVVACEGDAHGLEQHSVFTWRVRDDLLDFECADGLDQGYVLTGQVLNEWIESLDEDELPRVTEELFALLQTSGAADVNELLAGDAGALGRLVELASRMDDDAREVLVPALTSLAAIAARTAGREAGRGVRRAFAARERERGREGKRGRDTDRG